MAREVAPTGERELMQEERSEDMRGELNQELERRLTIVESRDYEDPARRTLPTADLVIVAASVLVTIMVLYWWGY